VPGFEIEGVLGRGGMGVIYRARQLAVNRPVALKMILAGAYAGTQERARLRTEAEAIARLRHPNIVEIYTLGEHDGLPYLALEFAEGGSLAQRLSGTPLPSGEAARLVETLARAIHAAHQHGVVHRDLKPANVLLTADGTPKVADFGLARCLDAGSGPTPVGAVLGTPGYMAPEQAAGKPGSVGPATDVYALGAILYELLAGRPPFRGETPLETIRQVVRDEPVPPRRLSRRVPRDLEAVCLRCLRKEPAERYATAEALAEELRRYLSGEPVLTRPAGVVRRAARWVGRHRAMAALTGAVLAAVLLPFALDHLLADAAAPALEAPPADAHAEAGRPDAPLGAPDPQPLPPRPERDNADAVPPQGDGQVQAVIESLDLGLIKKTPEIVKYLKDHDYKNVGVLRFQLQKGKGKPSYSAGPINGDLATRLENALLMETDPKNPIGIIRNASAVAVSKAPGKHWNEAAAADRASLFDYSYPLAWGDERVKPDAFLFGRVKLSEDMRTTTVQIACFDNKNGAEQMVCSVGVKTDRTVLADAGQSFELAHNLIKKREAETDNKDGKNKDGKSLDELLNDDAGYSALKRARDKDAGLSSEYVDFQVYYDDQPQPLGGDGELRVNPPRPGQKVSFSYKNKTQADIGLVVFVNGKSTLQHMTDHPEQCQRWILPADGKTYWIRGYLDENEVLTPFKIAIAGDDPVKNELADRLGLIEVAVFVPGPAPNAANAEALARRRLSLRSPSPYYQRKLLIKGKPKTAAEARALAFRSAGLKALPFRPRSAGDNEEGYFIPDPRLLERMTVEQRNFPNPLWVGTPIVIRYGD
jgi:hypothetical protein